MICTVAKFVAIGTMINQYSPLNGTGPGMYSKPDTQITNMGSETISICMSVGAIFIAIVAMIAIVKHAAAPSGQDSRLSKGQFIAAAICMCLLVGLFSFLALIFGLGTSIKF